MYVRKTLIIHKLTEINPFQRRSVNLKKMKFYIISYEATYPDDFVRLSIPNYKLAKTPLLVPSRPFISHVCRTTGCSGKIVFFHNSLQPPPRCKRPSKLSTQCECTVTPIG